MVNVNDTAAPRLRRLLTVEDTFAISGRGLMVAPLPALDEVRGPGDVDVELRLPDGTRRAARLSIMTEFVNPTPTVRRWACLFADLAKSELPLGTEIWCPEEIFVARLPIAR